MPRKHRPIIVFSLLNPLATELLEYGRVDARDCSHASRLVERIVEVSVRGVDLADVRDVAGGDGLEERNDACERCGVVHRPVALRISAKYQR